MVSAVQAIVKMSIICSNNKISKTPKKSRKNCATCATLEATDANQK